jgi:hypothetical protein
MATNILTQTRLKELLHYDPATGIFTWRIAPRHGAIGDVFGLSPSKGYLVGTLDGRMYKTHRLAWLYMHGQWPLHQIDHVNHIRTDNRIANLRDVTCAQNHQNRARKTRSASGNLGVTWHKRDARWQAHIERDGIAHYLGSFIKLDDAIAARFSAEQRYHPHRPK